MNITIKHLIVGGLLALSTLATQAAIEPLDNIVAIVDDDVITQSDVDTKLMQVKLNMTRQGREMPPQEEINKQVMERLILESLQLQLARRAGVHISEDQLTDAVANIAKRNNVSLQVFRQRLAEDGVSYAQMREQIRRDMTIQQVQQGNLRSRIQISDQDIANFLASAEGQAMTTTRYEVSHLVLPLAEGANALDIDMARKAMVTLGSEINANIASFDSYINGKKYQGAMISGADLGWRTKEDLPSLFTDIVPTLKAGEISAPIRSGAGWHLVKVKDISGKAQVVHQTHARHILVKLSEVRNQRQAQRLINSLYERIQSGEDFALLAKEYSEDPGSALQGGDLGWSMPGQFVPEFEKTLALLEIDAVSQPFESQFGWHIMQKLAERDHDMTQDSQKNKAYQMLFERRFTEELDSWLLKIRDEAFIELK